MTSLARANHPALCRTSRLQLCELPPELLLDHSPVAHCQLVIRHRVGPCVAPARQPVLLTQHQHQVLAQHLTTDGMDASLSSVTDCAHLWGDWSAWASQTGRQKVSCPQASAHAQVIGSTRVPKQAPSCNTCCRRLPLASRPHTRQPSAPYNLMFHWHPATHLVRDLAPQLVHKRHVLGPRHEVQAHPVQQPRVALLGRRTHVQLVEMALARVRAHAAHDLAGLRQAHARQHLCMQRNMCGVF